MSKANSIFQKWLKKHPKDEPTSEKVTEERRDAFPLSKEQVRLWVLSQLHPGNPVYNLILAFSFQGDINLGHLTHSINEVLQKHDILNTIITAKNESVNHYLKQDRVAVDVQNVQASTIEKARHLARQEAKKLGLKPFNFDLELVRATILDLGNNEFWFVFVAHHLIFDKQSAEILLQEILSKYGSRLISSKKHFSEDVNTFANYIILQQNKATANTTVDYWKKQFSLIPEPISWPFDYAENQAEQFAGGQINLRVPEGFQRKLTQIAKEQGTSLFVVLLTLYESFLAIYLDTTDICVGIPVTNRTDERWQNTIGFFDNTLALRSDIDLNKGLNAVLKKNKNTVADALEHSDMPFQELVRLVSPNRSFSNPLFQTMLVYHESTLDKQNKNQLAINEHRIDLGVSKFDLTLYCQKNENVLELVFEAADRIFNEQKKRELKHAFETFLENSLEFWEWPLASHSLLTKTYKRQLLEDWGSGTSTSEVANSIPQLFSKQVQNNKQNCAISDGIRDLTYEQFDNEIEKLSIELKHVGVTEGSIVALCLERSIDAVTTIYALYRLGAAYVPVDPSYPVGRVALMIEDAKVAGIITVKEHAEKFSFNENVLLLNPKVIGLTGVNGKLKNDKKFLNGAYILFTSGSTGRPKGVQITQSNLVHSTQNRFSFYQGVPKRFLLLPSFSFDSSVAGLFWPLCSGGSLYVPPHELELDIEALAHFIDEHKITATLILPSLYKLLLEHADTSLLTSLETVIVAGEACSTKLVDTHYTLLPSCELYNEYGPTEASVWSTACLLKQRDKNVPIGKPLNNTNVYVLNSMMQAVLPGHVGELYIGGKGISPGYVNGTLENSTAFVADPFNAGEKLYRSGDLARFDENGNLLFVGRKDQQVKINGKRVELQEISSSLSTLPGIEQCVVLHQEVDGSKETNDQLSAEDYFELNPERSEMILQQIKSYSSEELNALLVKLNDND